MNKQDYFARANSWASDTQAQAARSRRIAWTVAGIAVAVALFEAVALALLAPLKTVQPITLLVDRQTGYVQALNPLTPQRIAADDALTQSYLAQYVAAREGFDRATVSADYRKVALWSSGPARAGYLASMPATNPASPFQRYPGGTVMTVRVKSVSRLSRETALVRFDTQRRERDGREGVAQPWISVVRFRYVDAPMQLSDRLVNPLGFQVTSYRRDGETAEAPPPSPAMLSTVDTPAAPVALTQPPPARHAVVAELNRASVIPPVLRQRPVTIREVPINQLPMGSPLSPGVQSASSETRGQP